ncbi:serine hydrolase domain-containing protein [Hyunsoonleella pacifica]|uniref:Class A beta-lactamase-related serine hydrolase n=1 Tax=Hyunsoonleella pacifica TaxID=1080224 RepID=A0A4Q9FIQ1_9FLAO|nr:serine hydrolase domain-containing protein [Hyunsoonleella pacifica]TBN12443.1 class A beta-lactamase-related serine hydrolase [Hyunsoonleella pacifica]GGD29447.1 serine hydrolase [Hyunsoonleella pacifica]
MKKTKSISTTIVFLVLLLIVNSCKEHVKHNENNNATQPNPILDSITNEIESLYDKAVFNGFAVSIVDSTGILYNRGFGYADVHKKKKYTENTVINIASISKVFIAAALLKAEEMGFVTLDDPINKYLPFEVVNPNYPDISITIRQLATHTSSIVDTDIYMQTCYVNKDDIPISEQLKRYELYYQNPSKNWMPLADYMRKVLKKDEAFYSLSTFPKRKPGALREYSNIGAALCALVVEYASNTPFNEFTKEHIFQPLNMNSTTWFIEEADSESYSKLYYDDEELPYYKILSYPDGGLITSSTDLSKFLIELINGYSGKGSILNASSYKTFFKSQLEQDALGGKDNFNVGLFIDKELAYNVIGHTGGDPGTNTMMFFNTENKTGRIFITNTDSKKENSMETMWSIWDALKI